MSPANESAPPACFACCICGILIQPDPAAPLNPEVYCQTCADMYGEAARMLGNPDGLITPLIITKLCRRCYELGSAGATDLEMVMFDDLLTEIMKRCVSCILATKRPANAKGEWLYRTAWKAENESTEEIIGMAVGGAIDAKIAQLRCSRPDDGDEMEGT